MDDGLHSVIKSDTIVILNSDINEVKLKTDYGVTVLDVKFSSLSFLCYVILSATLMIFYLFYCNQKKRKKQKTNSKEYNNELYESLITLFDRDTIFLDSNLKLLDVAKLLNSTTKDVSSTINKKLNINFNDFVNSYRIKNAILMIQEDVNESFSLAEIAYTSGFNSLSTFINAFKKQKGITPSQFRKRLKKETFVSID